MLPGTLWPTKHADLEKFVLVSRVVWPTIMLHMCSDSRVFAVRCSDYSNCVSNLTLMFERWCSLIYSGFRHCVMQRALGLDV